MTILLTGSAGKTAAALAESLTPENKILVASRRPSPNGKHPTVRFDWLDDNTWPNVFSHAEAKASPISAVYLVLPDLPEARKNAIPFVRLCMSHGARRFVLLSAWENAEGGALLGGVHAELKAMGEREGIEWAVLRPHFFMGKLVSSAGGTRLVWPEKGLTGHRKFHRAVSSRHHQEPAQDLLRRGRGAKAFHRRQRYRSRGPSCST